VVIAIELNFFLPRGFPLLLHSLSGRKGYFWGYNAFGQVGDGTTDDKNVPILLNANGNDIRSVAVGQAPMTRISENL
jgi:hypothetical protein